MSDLERGQNVLYAICDCFVTNPVRVLFADITRAGRGRAEQKYPIAKPRYTETYPTNNNYHIPEPSIYTDTRPPHAHSTRRHRSPTTSTSSTQMAVSSSNGGRNVLP